MYKLLVKKNCGYCKIFKQTLIDFGVDFIEEEIKEGVAPMFYNEEELVFKGLPEYNQLLEYIENN